MGRFRRTGLAAAFASQVTLQVGVDLFDSGRAPLGDRALTPINLNQYLYGDANPVNLVDPTGRAAAAEYALAGRRRRC